MDDYFSSFAQSAHTLPRNFTFHYQDGDLPKTPEPSDNIFPQRTSPPPIPAARVAREPYRLRRRRAPLAATQRAIRAINRDEDAPADPFQDNQDVPLPSIELTSSTGQPAELQEEILGSKLFSPPKTPVAQIYGPEEDTREASSSQEDLTRPSTACSGFSDSSKSSSIESFPSFGESCGSPKSSHDPFTVGAPAFGLISSPLQEYGFSALPTFHASRTAWTQEMDDHLWITYMRYLQDPRHTPFKMLPGTAPPPGVCSKVVREAKRTWKGHLTSSVPKVHRFARWGSHRAETPQTHTAESNADRRSLVPWPRSDAATRKHLRDLCKLKPTLSAHYGRLLHARSPSPFLSSSVGHRSTSVAREVPSAETNVGAFSTRDMNISLATSVSTTMQPTHPLVQLGSEAATTPVANVPHIVHPSEASTPRPRATTHDQAEALPPRTPNHQKSYSMQESSLSSMHPRPLASPFQPRSFKPKAYAPQQSSSFDSSSAVAGPLLATPAELHAPIPRRSFFKRPAQNELNDMMHSEDPYTRQRQLMKDLFGSTQPIETSHRRVRSRGFSLGDMTAASRLESLFSEPSQSLPEAEATLPPIPRISPPASSGGLLPPPSIGKVARLGSPFAEKPATKTHFNTFPRNFSLLGLEPAMDIEEDAAEAAAPLLGLGQS